MRDPTPPLTLTAITDRTRAYIRDNFLYMRPDWPLQDDDALFGSGVIDSIGVVELIGFLQSEFGCTVAEDEVTERNLGSVGAIARFLYAKCNTDGVRAA